LEERDDLLIVRFDAQLYFANLNYFKEVVEALVAKKGPNLRFLLIDAESINYVDSSAFHTLEEMIEEFKIQGVLILFAAVKGPVRDAMAKAGIVNKVGEDHFFMDIHSVLEYVEAHAMDKYIPDGRKQYTLQVNK
jgi:SulP family sulfate permease